MHSITTHNFAFAETFLGMITMRKVSHGLLVYYKIVICFVLCFYNMPNYASNPKTKLFPTIIISGNKFDPNNPEIPIPLIAISHDGGQSWQSQNVSASAGFYYDKRSTCLNDGSTCVLTAESNTILVSNDKGINWELKTIPGTSDLRFSFPSCTETNEGTICVVTGFDMNPYLGVSFNAGRTWKLRNFPELFRSFLSGISCSGKNEMPVCVVVGMQSDRYEGLLLVTKDGGDTWQRKKDVPNSWLRGVSCSGEGDDVICIGVGTRYDKHPNPPFVMVSIDGGVTWGSRDIIGLDKKEGMLHAISCTNDAKVCVAAGHITDPSYSPVVVVSTDRGSTWRVQPIANALTDGEFTHVNCSESNEFGVVCAAGGDTMVAVGHYPGGKWKKIENAPQKDVLDLKCMNDTCIAAFASSEIFASFDGGETWEIKKTDIPFVSFSTVAMFKNE